VIYNFSLPLPWNVHFSLQLLNLSIKSFIRNACTYNCF
jgi:hypothetical protein